MKLKPESEISSHITLTSVISGLFLAIDIFTEGSLTGTCNSKCEVGCKTLLGLPRTPANILAAVLTW